jgi:hypothetical protein
MYTKVIHKLHYLDPQGKNVTTVFKITWAKIQSKSKAAVQDELDGVTAPEEEKGDPKIDENHCSAQSKKFYRKRRYLFSKYDFGIKLDDESWYSVTPESVGEYIAERVASTFPGQEVNVLDAFAG